MRTTIWVGLLTLALSGCKSEGKSETKTENSSNAAATAKVATANPTHAEKGAVPGSHEDWCGSHQVPESLCTRCNASLIPAFKKTGDWCAKHSMPESQCLACNPGLKIKRPPKLAGK